MANKKGVQIAGNNSTQISADVINIDYKNVSDTSLMGEIIDSKQYFWLAPDKLLICSCCSRHFYIHRCLIPQFEKQYLVKCPHCGFMEYIKSYLLY